MSPHALRRLIVLAVVLGIGATAFVPLRREALLTGQTTPRCGNGLAEWPGEWCDDGNQSNADSCTNACQFPRCGDGFVQTGVEQCDDGNTNPGDGCSAVCTLEAAASCGNGLAESPTEECDDGNADNTDRCTTSCRLARCGDGFVQQGEGCDDGNTNPNDGCDCMTLSNNAQCIGITDVPPSVTAGQRFTATVTMKNTGGKEWTQKNTNDQPNHYLYDVDWKNGGFTTMRWGVATALLPTSRVNPSANAAFSIAATAPAQAGSYTFQWAMLENGAGYFGATCTKTITVTAAASSAAQTSSAAPPPSSASSQSSRPLGCGNGIREGYEQCDDGNADNTDFCSNACHIQRCGDDICQVNAGESSYSCVVDCRSQCPRCGNGIREEYEQCDDGNLIDTDACRNNCRNPQFGTCGDLICNSSESWMSCPSDCFYSWCGNGIQEGYEECDDGNANLYDACQNCKIARCGDGVTQTGVEECDAGLPCNMNWDAAAVGCTPSCRLPACGDGFCQQQVPATGYNESCNDCPSDCGSCPNLCGNRRLDPGEECDDGNTTNGDGCSSACKTEVASACRNGRDDTDRDADIDCADIGCIDPDSQVGNAVRCDPDGATETDPWDTAGDRLPDFFDNPMLIRNPSVEVQRESRVSSFFRRLLGQAIPPDDEKIACVEAGGIVLESDFRISNNLSQVNIKKISCADKKVPYTFPQKISPTQDALSARGAIAQGCYSGVAGDPVGGCYGAASKWMRDFVLAAAKEQEKPSLQNGRIHRIVLEWCRADCVCQGAKDDATDTKKRIQDAAKTKRDDVQAQYSAMVLNGSPEQVAKALEWSTRTLADIAAKEKEDLDALQNVMDGATGQCFQQCMTGQRFQAACPAREPDCCSSMCISTMCPVQRPTAVTNMRYISLCEYLAQVALPCGGQGPGGPGSTIILPATSSSSAPVPTDIGTSSSVVSDVPAAPPVSTASAPPVPVAPPTSQGASSLSVVISARSESSSSRSSGGSSVRSSAPASVVFSVSSVRQSSSAVSSSRMSSAASVAMQRSSALLSAVCPPDPCADGGSAYCGGRAMLCVPLSVLPCFSCTAAGSVASSSIRSVAAAFSVASAASSKPAPLAVPPPPLTPPPSSRPPLPPPAPPIPAVVATLPTDVLPALVRCGDGRREGGEECDDGNLRDFDGCSGDCFLERGICGDDTVQSLLGEQCEPSSHDVRLPYGCSPLCRFTSALCGNGRPDPGEECDGGAANSDVSNAYCRTDCGLARCGDRIVDAPTESCDDGNRVGGDGCSDACIVERAAPLSPLAAQVFDLPTVPGMPTTASPVTYTLPWQAQQQQQVQGVIINTLPPQNVGSGPGTLGVMAAGAAAGVGWARRKHR